MTCGVIYSKSNARVTGTSLEVSERITVIIHN